MRPVSPNYTMGSRKNTLEPVVNRSMMSKTMMGNFGMPGSPLRDVKKHT
jgi:hypothetical protein